MLPCPLCAPLPPCSSTRKVRKVMVSDGFEKAVLVHDAQYQKTHVPKTCPYLTLSTIVTTGH